MKIDAFCHVMPPSFMRVFRKKVVVPFYVDAMRTLWDLDARFRIMDRYEDYRQVISLSSPSLESVASPETAAELARVANDAMSVLGEALTGQGKFDEAEPLLLEGYESMIPPPARVNSNQRALKRIVELYDAWHEAEPDAGHDTQGRRMAGEAAAERCGAGTDPIRSALT